MQDATQPDKVTRWVEAADGQVAVQTSATGDRVLQLVDLHGDVVGTVPIHDGAPLPSWQELSYVSYDEFGHPQPLSGGASSNAPPRYGWLGAAQRSVDTPAGVVLMGVRLYHPGIGRFLQVDPVAGGSANAYGYCNADPVNCTDLGGTIAWGKVLGAVATVGEVASFIPGPIGAAAAGISAVAYAASGNKGKAILMGVAAAATLVGAGLAVRAASQAMKVRYAARLSRVYNGGKARVRVPVSSTKRFDIDLHGKSHFDKIKQRHIKTPYVVRSRVHPKDPRPTPQFTRERRTRNASWFDLIRTHRHLRSLR